MIAPKTPGQAKDKTKKGRRCPAFSLRRAVYSGRRRRTGWESKPEGLCQEDRCVPAPGVDRGDGTLDVTVLADRLGMPLVHDEDHALWALGPATATGRSTNI